MKLSHFVRLAALSSLSLAAVAQQPVDRLTFQTDKGWSPRVNIGSGSVIIYGFNDSSSEHGDRNGSGSLDARVASWRSHGYHVAFMTGVAWGRYGDYLRGEFDGKEHWNETQQEKSGKLILHTGREVPYIAPSQSYGKYLSVGVLRALDAGVEAIFLEEPEFWARAGWSDAFKQEWQAYYNEPWQEPDSSPDAQYRASKLKYFLYRRALADVFTAVRQWNARHGKHVPCYVATHSLINYAQWQIVSPESSLLDVGADGYIAQVWTGTSRQPNVYEGVRAERTFETAFLEYGALQNIARSSGKRIWYLNDPIEDNPNHSWTDYRRNWESTLVASLLQPEVANYEILPWPDRIFGPKAFYPETEPTVANPNPKKIAIPPAYQTELQTVFHALGQMAGQQSHWQTAGTDRVGILASDTLMFQRAKPQPSDADLSSFYGLALPLLMRGLPVEPVQMESAYRDASSAAFLKNYKVLLLTYEGQKPPSPKFHAALAAWVKTGGVLVVVDNDNDPYNHAHDWWNQQDASAIPREALFRALGLDPQAWGTHRVRKGAVIALQASPAELAHTAGGAQTVASLTQKAATLAHLPWSQSSALVLRRGPYVIAAGLESSGSVTLPGRFLDLFDAKLGFIQNPTITAGSRRLLLDPAFFPKDKARVLAASGATHDEAATATRLSFNLSSIEGRGQQDETLVRIATPHTVTQVRLDGIPVEPETWSAEDGLLLLHLPARAAEQSVVVEFPAN